jgi:hypothetical protein
MRPDRLMRFENVLVQGRQIDRGPAEAARLPGGRLRRQWKASGMHGVLPGGEGTLASILDEVGFRASGQVFLPLAFLACSKLEA